MADQEKLNGAIYMICHLIGVLTVEVLSACSSSTSTLQEKMLYNSINTPSAATISVYTTEALG